MKHWSFYDPATGLLTGRQFTGPEDMLEYNTPAGHATIEGHHDRRKKRVDLASGELVDHELPPSEVERKRDLLRAIAALELQQHRALREAVLGIEGGLERLRTLEGQIAQARAQLQPIG